jgi:predicted DNA-binding transcriptional regulator AlpA
MHHHNQTQHSASAFILFVLAFALAVLPAPAFAGTGLPVSVGAYLPFCYLTIAQVVAAVGLSTSRIYELIKLGAFPAGDLLGKQSRRWKSSSISAWLIEQSEQSAQRQADLAPALKRKADRAASISASKRAARAAGSAI